MQVQILDGAIGTELISRGVELRAPQWSAIAMGAAPDVLRDIHRDYANAGATLHIANTFRTQPRAFGEGWRDALGAAIRIARQALPTGCTLLGSIAPVEDCYRPELSPGAEARVVHEQLAAALAAAGCDALICETHSNAAEALAASEAAISTGLPTWLSLTAGPFAELATPAQLGAIAKDAASIGVERVLVNCIAATQITPYLEAIERAGVPMGAYANAGAKDEGLGWEAAGRRAAEAYADLAERWVQAGASVVGGCCGTGPLHVQALAERLA